MPGTPAASTEKSNRTSNLPAGRRDLGLLLFPNWGGSIKTVFFHPPVKSSPAQPQDFGCLADVSAISREGLADQQGFGFFQAHVPQTDRTGTAGELQSEISRLNFFVAGHNDGALNRVVQFSHVAGPAILQELLHRFRGECFDLLPVS